MRGAGSSVGFEARDQRRKAKSRKTVDIPLLDDPATTPPHGKHKCQDRENVN